jgi:hypothetical protein
VNQRHARKLRKLSEFKPHAKRYYHQFNNSNNYVMGDNGRLERGPGTIIEVTDNEEAHTTRAVYKYMKREYYDRSF